MDANRTRWGLSAGAMAAHVTQYGFTVQDFPSQEQFEQAITDEMDYLANKGLAEEVLKIVSRENRAWRITKSGISFVDEQI